MRSLDVGVIGCGTAGPAASLFLAKQGHRVTIYERFTEPRPVGAGIILQPTGQAVLARLGLADEVIGRGERLDGLRVLREGAGALLELRYADVNERHFGVGLRRGALFSALYRAVEHCPAITLRLGVTGWDLQRDGARRYVVDEHGERHGPHDLVIVADGARSRFRDDTGLTRKAEAYPWGALWFVAKDPDRVYRDELHQVVRGTRRMLGLLPTGVGPDDAEGRRPETPLVSLYWSIAASEVDAWRTSGFEAWKDEIRAMDPRATFVLDQIGSPDDVLFSAYHDVVMQGWSSRGVAYLGDAAHAMSPQLGQGANLALWDAMALADAIEAERGELVRALDRYTRTRRGHLGYYQLVTRWLTPFFQSDHDALGLLRDLGMPLLARLGPFRRAMVLGMCGTVDGHPWKTLAV